MTPEELQAALNRPSSATPRPTTDWDETPPWSFSPEPLQAPFPGYTMFETQPNLVEPEGNGAIRILFMGEAPGEREDYDRKPFRPMAQAGSVLQRAFNELGISRDGVTITNASWFRPPRNWLEGAEWETQYVMDGRTRNVKLIQERRPEVIVALGKTAFQELTGLYEVGIEQGRGFIVPAREQYGRIPVVGTYHPSFIIRGAKRKSTETGAMTEKQSGGGWGFYSVLKRDIALAMMRLRQPFMKTDFNSPGFNKFGSGEDWQQVIKMAKEHPDWPISYDFETPLSVVQTDESEFAQAMGNITQFQVSLYPGHALVSSWDYSLFPLIKELMELPNHKLDWNGRGFDRDILRNLGIKPVGEYHDLMRMWSHWERDLPRGLQFATSFVSPEDGPWKHLFDKDLRSYGIRDVHEPQKIWNFLRSQMQSMKHPAGKSLLWGYERQVYQLHTHVLEPLQIAGIPVDDNRRIEMRECLIGLEEIVAEEINELVPEHLKPTKQADGLKDVPKELVEEVKPDLEATAATIAEQEVAHGLAKKVTKKRTTEIYKENLLQWKQALRDRVVSGSGKIYVQRMFPITDQFDRITSYEKRWAELEPFNSNSSQQLMAYIQWRSQDEIAALGSNPSKTALKNVKWKVPIDFKTKKPTTAKKELDRLTEKTNDTVLKLVVESRELGKMRSTYVEGWAPGPDGRVHPFYDDNTGTSQLTAVRPAALTFPKHLKRKIHFSPGTPVELVRGCRHQWNDNPDSPGGYLCGKCGIPSRQYELGKFVRGMITPRPGHRIVECVSPETRVLTEDMNWVRADSLKIGDRLVGFDEESQPMGNRTGRRLKRSTVTDTYRLNAVSRVTLHTDKGDITVSANHLFLARMRTNAGKWVRADEIKVGHRLSFFTEPWARESSHEASYLAGFLDGEGFINRAGRVGFGQNPGPVSDYVRKLLADFGFDCIKHGTKRCEAWDIQSGKAFTGFRLVGMIKPLRLAANLQKTWEGRAVWGKRTTRATVISISHDVGDVIAIATSSKTLITEGFLSHNCDFKAFHVLTTGFEAGDEKYMRLARLDMHSFIAATQLLGLAKSHELLAMPDAELMKVLKSFRKDTTPRYHGPGGIKVPFEYVRGKQAKPAILGYGFGMQPPRFYHENQEFLPSREFAFQVFAGLDREFPICCGWRKQIVQLADRQGGYLLSRHGFLRRFNCCVDKFPVDADYSPRPGDTIRIAPDGMRWCFSPGDDGEAIIAFLPANDAFGMIKECMLRMRELGLLERYGLIIPIHDALVFECPDEYVQEALPVIKREMETPSDILILPNGEGLWCEAELSINKPGLSWADMEDV